MKRLTNAELDEKRRLLEKLGCVVEEKMNCVNGRIVPYRPRRFAMFSKREMYGLPGHGGTTTHRAVLEILRRLT